MSKKYKELVVTDVRTLQFKFDKKLDHQALPKITCSRDSFNVLSYCWENIDMYESFKVLYLTRANKVIGQATISKGGMTGTVVDTRMVFSTALSCGACYIVLAHNHPSGNLHPSPQDISLTGVLAKAGKLLSIKVIDHIIVAEHSYYSFADEGCMPSGSDVIKELRDIRKKVLPKAAEK